MFFRRPTAKVPSFSERIDSLREAGFTVQSLTAGHVRVTKHGVGAVLADAGMNQPLIERAGVMVGEEIAVLLSGGYQMFIETPSGKRLPATATQLKALHEFEEDVKEALGLTSLYNQSLGTTSRKHMYDRVTSRDQGAQPKPWEHRRTER